MDSLVYTDHSRQALADEVIKGYILLHPSSTIVPGGVPIETALWVLMVTVNNRRHRLGYWRDNPH